MKKSREHILKSVMQKVHLCSFLLINMTYLISMLKQTATRGHQSECGYPKKEEASQVDDKSRSKRLLPRFPLPKGLTSHA